MTGRRGAPGFPARGGNEGFAFAAVLTAFCLCILIAAAPATALTSGYKYSFSFGSQGSGSGQFNGGLGTGLAIDQSNGDVYVADIDFHRVVKFDASGNFLAAWGWGVADGAAHSEVCTAPGPCQEGISGTGPGQFRHPSGIAVDNSGGPNDGDVYVADGDDGGGPIDHGAILKFDSDGSFLAKIDGGETSGGVFGDVPFNGAVSTDASGYVWFTAGPVMKFGNDPFNEFVPGSEWAQSGIRSVTVNDAGTRLLVHGTFEEPDTPYLASPGGAKSSGHLPCGGYFSGGTTFDSSTGNFLVANGGSVCVFTQKGEQVGEPFGSGILGGTQGLAVNAGTGNVYVVDSGRIAVFEPRVVPDVATGDAESVSHTGATLTGQVAPDPTGGGDVTGCHFDIGTDTSYGTEVPCQPATPYTSSTAVTADVSGLAMETTYHYRLVASNSVDSNPGSDRTFTPRAVLGLSTDEATQVSQRSARLNGSLDPSGEATHYYFEWGPDTSYGNLTSPPPGDDAGSASGRKSVSAEIDGLSPTTKYHYRLVAVNSVGTSYGEDRTVVTAAPEPPEIGATTATGVGGTAATLSTVVDPGLGETTYGFEYGIASPDEVEVPASTALAPGSGEHPFSIGLTGLEPGTTYLYRVFAVNFGGTTHSPVLSFTTLAAPSIVSAAASEVTQTTAILSTQLRPNRSETTYRFEYGATSGYGSSTRESAIGADGSEHTISVPLSGLQPDTTYHFRVVAQNAVGQTVDVDRVFKTSPAPASQPGPPPKCKKRFVKRKKRCVKKRNAKPKRRHHHRAHPKAARNHG
jgi:phosphodiesterase/alkaline phosphatase D-like protein